jgi:hypothetical protein
MNLLVPCAGKSSRFQTRAPKYLLALPDGRAMVETAIAPFLGQADRVVFAILKEHDLEFRASAILRELVPGCDVLVLEDVTRGQGETVARMIKDCNVDGPFLVKDSDSYFEPSAPYDHGKNYISVCSARDVRDVKLYNKSFAVINEQGYIVGTAEKEITSEFFSCGGYFFSDAKSFLIAFDEFAELQHETEFFLSQIIDLMIEQGHVFCPMPCQQYADWGTHSDWVAWRQKVRTFLIDLDGVIYKNGTRFWEPRWAETEVIPSARAKVNDLYDAGNYIVLVTSRLDSFRQATLEQLRRDGVKFHQVITGVYHGCRVVINDFGSTNPYPAAVAINSLRDSGDFIDKV